MPDKADYEVMQRPRTWWGRLRAIAEECDRELERIERWGGESSTFVKRIRWLATGRMHGGDDAAGK